MKGIILAGGSGSRLWPLSRKLYPKHLLNLDGDMSLYQCALMRLGKFIAQEDIVTVTNVSHSQSIKLQLAQINNNSKIITEPIAKNTAPAVACSLQYFKDAGDDIVVIVPSDHLISDIEGFEKSVREAVKIAEEGYIVTIGVKPTCPETGFGYIKVSDTKIKEGFIVDKFIEKPSSEKAKEYIADNNYFWNCGIFISKISVLLEEFSKYFPDLYSKLNDDIFDKFLKIKYCVYEDIPSISLDYAILEKSDKIACVKLAADWCDLGSWESLYQVNKKDENGNVINGNVLTFDVKDSMVYSSKELVVLLGVKDVIAIGTEDAFLVCSKEKSQDIRKVYDYLQSKQHQASIIHKTVYRPWGYYTCLNSGSGWLTKMICVSPHHKLSYQSHECRSEHWVVLEGTATVILEGQTYTLSSGQSLDIPTKAKHSLQNHTDEEIKIMEVQKGSFISEDDIVRYEDIYGRA